MVDLLFLFRVKKNSCDHPVSMTVIKKKKGKNKQNGKKRKTKIITIAININMRYFLPSLQVTKHAHTEYTE